ncbi:hypothetical protein K491DRAFT_523522 [Lophiostoma macrostomum CBS 122681]|uniref:Rhodopsin domain-containing protein n=1 Tax=Lophiostoma macrostomum CBS 122681 TaxID=1314788 RepID=A0A6A6T2S9_9PLEO|nr:hypothetical protein K491DRAFT_523522 [Lophiostoma macrostomum CBS 122681]
MGQQHIEDAAAKLSRKAFLAIVGTFTGLAVLAVIGRVSYHIRKRGRPSQDDWLVLFSACCLAIVTGLICYMQHWMYMTAALAAKPGNAALFTHSELESLPGLLKWNNLFLVFSWTYIMAIKMSFLVLFWLLIRDVSRRLTNLWWCVMVLTILSWLFNILRNPINCGWATGHKCSPVPRYVSELGWTSSAVDIATDVLIILIPVLLLRNSLLPLKQKLRILTFLCLNVFQISICLGRTIGSGFHDRDGRVKFGIVYTFLLIHVEASVAVIMGGVTAFRSVFALRAHDRDHERPSRERRWSKVPSRILSWLRIPSSKSKDDVVRERRRDNRMLLPGPVTGGTLRGLRSFIRRHDRTPGHTTGESSKLESTYDSVQTYHEYMRTGGAKEPSVPMASSEHKPEPAVYDETARVEKPLPTLQPPRAE